MAPRYVTLANIIVDDILLPGGETRVGTLGGAGIHAAAGMRAWSREIGLCAAVGDDFPAQMAALLAAYGVDTAGVVIRHGRRTTRAWQLFDSSDQRTEIFRTSKEEFRRHMQPRLDEIPDNYFAADGWHVQWGTLAEVREFAGRIRRARPGVVLTWEPTASQIEEGLGAWSDLLPQCAVVSPNLAEAARLCGTGDATEILDRLCRLGAPLVALRMGKDGSLVRRASDGRTWQIPAAPAAVVDVTGAGNAYCGGFTVAFAETHDPFAAGLRAAVSASFAVEQFGPAPAERLTADEARMRLVQLGRLAECG